MGGDTTGPTDTADTDGAMGGADGLGAAPSDGAADGPMTTAGTGAGDAGGDDASSGGDGDDAGDDDAGSNGDDATSADAWWPCDGDPGEYDATAIESGGTWTVQRGSDTRYTGGSMQDAMVAALGSLDAGRSEKQSVLVRGDGSVSASAQLRVPSYTVLNVCGTIDVTGAASGSDRSPIYARGATDIDVPHVTITGAPQYAMFFRETSNVRLGQIELRLDASAGRGLRIDHSSSSSPGKPMYRNYVIDRVFVSGSGGHGVETYGIDDITIGEVIGENTGDCGLLLNYTTNAEVGLVDCTDCGAGTGYAAFRIANQAGNVDDAGSYPAGNIHVGEVRASGGGRGIFCVSASGGLTVDRFHVERAGTAPAVFVENCYNVTLGAEAGTLIGGQARIGYNAGNGDPSSNVIFQNVSLEDASVLESPCNWGDLGNRADNVSGGSVSMCAD
jgi:hypothetical protein